MSKAYTGGCACGAVRYEISGEPLAMSHCQCRDCQRISGTGHGSYLVFNRADMKVEGKTSQWGVMADSGNVKTREFCPTCGSPSAYQFRSHARYCRCACCEPGRPERFEPAMVTYRMRGYGWDSISATLKAFEKMPTG